MAEEESKQGFKVSDKRLFDEQGNERPEGEAAAGEQEAEEGSFVLKDSSEVEDELPRGELDFNSFVMSLATQALIQLGEVPSPEGMDIKPDKVAAKQTIDILNILHDKTKGNLDEAEEKLLEEILHSVRMSFVRKSS